MKKKTVALLLALTLVLGVAAGGTIAWLTDTTTPVKNTFTTSDITINLEETKGTNITDGKSFQMVPGWTIEKDPKAWVKAGSEVCYLFVKLDKSTNFDTYLSYEVDTSEGNWTKLNGVTDEVYYRIVKANEMGDTNKFSVLKGDKVTVNDSVTKEQMNGLTKDTYPTLTVTAYACQYYKDNIPATAGETGNVDSFGHYFSAADAWNNAKPATTTTP